MCMFHDQLAKKSSYSNTARACFIGAAPRMRHQTLRLFMVRRTLMIAFATWETTVPPALRREVTQYPPAIPLFPTSRATQQPHNVRRTGYL